MAELKPLQKEAIPAALEKAKHYRLLNEPAEAESICLDVLQADPENQQAIITLLLAVTDRFYKGYGVSDTQAKELLSRMKSGYDRAYYSGIVAERRAKMKLRQHTPDCRFQAYDLLREAMSWFEKAEPIRPPGHDDAILRWNTCARIIDRNNLFRETGRAHRISSGVGTGFHAVFGAKRSHRRRIGCGSKLSGGAAFDGLARRNSVFINTSE